MIIDTITQGQSSPIALVIASQSTNWLPPRYAHSDEFVIMSRAERILERIHEDIALFTRECGQALAEMKLAYREAREYEARSIRRTRLRTLPPPERVRWKRRTRGEASRWRVMT